MFVVVYANFVDGYSLYEEVEEHKFVWVYVCFVYIRTYIYIYASL